MNTVVETACPPLPSAPDYRQAARYLGVHTDDESTRALLTRCAPALWQAARPRAAWVCMPTRQLDDWPLGEDITAHLDGCHSVCLMAVTLGMEVDALLRRLAAQDMAQAAAADALASALAEQIAAQAEDSLRGTWQPQGEYLTGRFSPGYGDSPLALQPRICVLLDSERRLGLFVSESLLLTPRKSITAFLGVADHPVTGKLAGCAHCKLRETCTYRKRGITCAAD